MSATNFGVNSAPVGTTVTTPYVNPVIPTPIPSAGAAMNLLMIQQLHALIEK